MILRGGVNLTKALTGLATNPEERRKLQSVLRQNGNFLGQSGDYQNNLLAAKAQWYKEKQATMYLEVINMFPLSFLEDFRQETTQTDLGSMQHHCNT